MFFENVAVRYGDLQLSHRVYIALKNCELEKQRKMPCLPFVFSVRFFLKMDTLSSMESFCSSSLVSCLNRTQLS